MSEHGGANQPDTARSGGPAQRVHLIVLGVRDVSSASAFYEALGWRKASTSHAEFVKFDLGGYALCLLQREAFARDALEPTAQGSGFAGFALAYLARAPEEVAAVLARAAEAGGTVVKAASPTAWGVAGFFKDPDGHLFEVIYEQGWILDQDHRLEVEQLG
ncbi:VOC family protein [Dactylosporangium sp. CA-139114]|uniref:VOC family protein n=1 Tax=Dactylosporangium sp. CA-139114 TaxID=3239931 RepID=UPI003D9848C0